MCPAEFERPQAARTTTEPKRPAPVVRRVAAPLVVGSADDTAERDADRVAHDVLTRLRSVGPGSEPGEAHVHDGCHGDETRVSRLAAPSGEAPEVGYEGGAISEGLSTRIQSARGGGTPLPDGVRRRMESGFGTSLSHVRVHDDARSAQLNRSVSARAFTTGNDIFFGAGEYRPDSPQGERVLAHEIAHTQQQGSGARRAAIRRWDMGAKKMDWSQTQSISTLSSGQQVYFFKDGGGDQIVVKAEDRAVGLAELSSVMHESLSGVKSVRHRKLDRADMDATVGQITDPALQDTVTFAKLGAAMNADRRYSWVMKELELKRGLTPGTGPGQISDLEVGQHLTEQLFAPAQAPKVMVAMSFAAGDTAAKTTDKADTSRPGGVPEKNRMRSLLTDWAHLEALGKLTAVDLFLGNRDRVISGNLGNWIYDPQSTAMTAIDHVDGNVATGFVNKDATVDDLALRNLSTTAHDATDAIVSGMKIFANDPDARAWMDEAGTHRREVVEEALENGMKTGRELLIKTFSATRFTKGGKSARAVKKSIKSAAIAGLAVDKGDATDPEEYYKILKSRAAWLKKN